VPKKNGACSGSFFSRTSKTRPWELEPLLDLTSTMGIYYHLTSIIIYYHLLTICFSGWIVWVELGVLCFHPSSCGMCVSCLETLKATVDLSDCEKYQIYAATDASHSEEKRRMYSGKMNRWRLGALYCSFSQR
jgi:hypothetical protein